MKTDPKVRQLLQDASKLTAQERTAAFDLLAASFRVTVAGVDVTKYRAKPRPEPELRKGKKP